MKKLCLIILTLAIAVIAHAEDIVQSDNKAIIVKQENPTAVFTFEENRTTGYLWYIEDYPSEVVEHISSRSILPAKNDKALGAPGMVEWQITLNESAFFAHHLLEFKFKLARSWDLGSATERTIYIAT